MTKDMNELTGNNKMENKDLSSILLKALKSPTSPIEEDFFDKARDYAVKIAGNQKQ